MSKTIVIIGASAAGGNAAKQLLKTLPSTYRIVLIEQNNFAYWPIGALRAMVQPGFEESIIAPLDRLLPAKSRHIMITGRKVVTLRKDRIVLDSGTSDFPDGKISFERAILAMGSIYSIPCRPMSVSASETKATLKRLQTSVKNAKSIVIIGGGPVGVEFAGEVMSVYPDKKITLVSGTTMLISSVHNEKLHSKLLSQLQKGGVKLLLGQRLQLEDITTRALDEMTTFTTDNGLEIKCDFIMNGSGARPNSSLVQQLDPTAVDKQGYVRVNADLTVKSPELSRYYAIGDLNDKAGGKTYLAATAQVPALVANVVAQANRSTKRKDAAEPMAIMSVPLGPKGGATQLPFGTFGSFTTTMVKGKGLFLPNFNATYA